MTKKKSKKSIKKVNSLKMKTTLMEKIKILVLKQLEKK